MPASQFANTVSASPVDLPSNSDSTTEDLKNAEKAGANGTSYFELPKLSKFVFPIPQEYDAGSAPPAYADISPFHPLGRPKTNEKSGEANNRATTVTASDVKPDLRSFDLMKSSIREVTDCKAIFNGLVEGIERRHTFFPMDEVEKDVYGKVLALRSNADAVLHTCDDLALNCRAFAAAFERRLAEIAISQGGGALLPDNALEEIGRNLLRMSEDMSTHVKIMLMNLHDLTRFIQSTKDSDKTSLRKKIWDWLVRAFKALKRIFLSGAHAVVAPVRLIVGTSVTSAASSLCMTITSGCDEKDGFERVLAFLQREIPAAAERAEKHLTSFQAYQKILQGPLGIGEGKGTPGVRMEQKEASDARRDWYSAVVKLQDKR